MKRRGAVLLFAVVAAVGLYAVPAGAVGHHRSHARVLVVDDDAGHRTCYGKHHRRFRFRTIQSAVDAADPGDTIKVCPGRYEETVKVEEPDITIKGANAGRDATGHHRGRESIVAGVAGTMVPGLVQLLADDITWDGFTILGAPGALDNPPGMYTSPTASGYLIRDTIFQDNGNGIHLGASGAHPTLICRNRFVANNEFEGATGAYGIYSNEGARQVLITANRFERHNAAAIFLGDQGAQPRQQDVLIEHNKSVEDLSFATMFNSRRVRVTSNWIRARVGDKDFPGPASAIFIGARNDDVVVQKNKVKSASGNGIDISNTGGNRTPGPAPRNVVVRRNKVAHTELAGIAVSATGAGQYQILANHSRDNTRFGIHFAPGTVGGTITGNTALDNGRFDCLDESTGLKNTWTGNTGRTAEPANICSALTVDDDPGHDGKGHHKKKYKKHHKKTKKHKKYRPDPCTCTLPWRF
jgi:nitrous oxidase accessory protein NosD